MSSFGRKPTLLPVGTLVHDEANNEERAAAVASLARQSPMRIVHCSNFSLRKNGSFFYGVPYKLSDGLTRLGHFVFDYPDRDVADGYFVGIRQLGVSHANRKLINVCQEVRPDMLLLGHCTIISPETLNTIRKNIPTVRIAHWNCDALFIPNNFKRVSSLVPLVDATFVTTAGEDLNTLSKSGGRVAFMPNPVDGSIETIKVFEKDGVENDLVFLTGGGPFIQMRSQICENIRARIPDLKFDVRGLFGHPNAYGARLFDVLGNAKMGLNISAKNDVHLYSSDRMSQLMGCGLLTFVDRRTGFLSIIHDDEAVFYEGEDELVEKLLYFRRNDSERREVAKRGWQRAHQIFNETLVARWIVEATFRTPPSQDYAWPTEIHET